MYFLTMRSQNFKFTFLIAQLVFFIQYVELVKVCKNFKDYFQDKSANCYDNPDSELNVTEILRQRWNCTAEEYNITTNDGYKLLLIRAYKEITHPTPIILGHGLLMNSLGFLTLYNQSLAYQIIQSGRQVFFLNFRGTRYSKGHTKNITHNDYEYWTFSFHEMAVYDTPKILELVKNITGEKSIFIGYSMSSTVCLIYASLFPEDASDKLVGIITMATTVFFESSTSLYKKLANQFLRMSNFAKYIWNGKLFCREELQSLMEYAASGPTHYMSIYPVIAAIGGDDIPGISPEFFPITALNIPDCVSHNTAIHFAQIITSGKFRQFDYGKTENLAKYGTSKPPQYDLFNINIPVAQIVGRGDILARVEDAKTVESLLNKKTRRGVRVLDYDKWTHDDFVDSRFQLQYLVPAILETIMKMEL